jgi:ABC-type lipoprotein release transport system permease subunit
VVLGVATAVAVLAGALLVGESVRGSLRGLVLDRIGKTDEIIVSQKFFTEGLSDALRRDARFASSFSSAAPLIVVRGIVTNQDNGRRAGSVSVYGVDDRFWRFHGVERTGPADRAAFVSEALSRHLEMQGEPSLVIRAQQVSDVPLESLHGRKEEFGRTLRVNVAAVLDRASLGEFSLQPSQGDVLAVFVPLSRLQEELGAEGRVNAILVARVPDGDSARGAGPAEPGAALKALVRANATLADAGITLTRLESLRTVVVAPTGGLLEERDAAAARKGIDAAGLPERPVFTYLANTLRIGDREVPYSLVSALDLQTVAPAVAVTENSIVLNEWAANDLRARTGDLLSMDYYVWEEPGRLVTRSATFTVAGVVPIAAGGRDLAPTFPGISDSPTLDDWDPPFPVDLRRVRRADEQYWEQYRTTPKAFIAIGTGQRLWRSRFGELTSLRVTVPNAESMASASERLADHLRQSIDPIAAGLVVQDVRAASLDASKGATDFGEYFVYFSFFLVVSALVLASLFFKLGVEQRLREVGLLRSVGFGPGSVRRLFLAEGLLLAVIGSALGLIAGIGYAALLMLGLRTWWVEAVGTTALTLHVGWMPLVAGALGGIAAAAGCIWWTLRSLAGVTERSLLMGETVAIADTPRRPRLLPLTSAALAVVALALLGAAAADVIDPAGAFFGAGFALMLAVLGILLWRFRQPPRRSVARPGTWALSRLGTRYASYRPGRSVLSAAVIACATFILIAVGAFRKDGAAGDPGKDTGVGGYSVIVDTLLPVIHDPDTTEGREALNLSGLTDDVRIAPFRVRPGDDASCLNLYAPENPRIMAPGDAFIEEARFTFSNSLATSSAARANPWLLLKETLPDGAVPVIGDANSMAYVLHRSLGEDVVIDVGGRDVRLRLVASLYDSIFQGELIMSADNFVRLFPDVQGYQRFMVEAPEGTERAVASAIEAALVDAGADAQPAWERLAAFHRVENTYLSTFQTLGGLGLLLGTVGLAAVLMRNTLERRRELGLLGAVGFQPWHLVSIVLAENALLLLAGMLTGALAAGLAIMPAIVERGGRLPVTGGNAALFAAVIAAGLLSSLAAVRIATRGSLLSSLRSE